MSYAALFFVMAALPGFEIVQEWDFRDEAAAAAWRPNAHLTDVVHRDGALHARAIDWDPFLICSTMDFEATSSQCVLIRMKSDAAGPGQLFWTARTEGRHGGFDGAKVTDFQIDASDMWQDIYIIPYWHREGVIRQLRLDVFDDARFAIAHIAVLERKDAAAPVEDVFAWQAEMDGLPGWLSLNKGRLLLSPPLRLPLHEVGWVSVVARGADTAAIALDWSADGMLGANRETIFLNKGDDAPAYHVELHGHPQWTGMLKGLAFHASGDAPLRLERVSIAPEPDGPPEIAVNYFGFEDAVSRAGRPESLLLQLTNRGGDNAVVEEPRLIVPQALRVLEAPARDGGAALGNSELLELRWRLQTDGPGAYQIALDSPDRSLHAETALEFLPAISRTADYVPEPRPIETTRHILAYYFPGWDADAKWECIRHGAPIRKPALGYYDEANPECVDWQIKWAVENGIRCFLVDWYWVDGAQSLLHWFDAYRQARYRDLLEVAIMWANHNPPETHSREDWRNVTREWIERYFTLDTYYHINGRPAVFLWDADIIRNDLGGSDEVAAAFAESQEMARAAGHLGIEFIILQHSANARDIERWTREGYAGNTSYHEWGNAVAMAPAPTQGRFEDIAATAPQAWEQRRALSQDLAYYPVVDTGWDSRPWHGVNARAFHGRNVALFRQLLEAAKEYCDQYDQEIVILGPLNEWGEGSYIEPNLEFGFGMYEAVREVFGVGAPETWPINLTHRDAGLGPYDFPPPPRAHAWHFNDGAEGWAAMMNVTPLRVDNGRLCFESTSNDPALVVSTRGLRAADYPKLRIRMQAVGPMPQNPQAQLFWSVGDRAVSEATSLRFDLARDGEAHDYTLDLGGHPRWRGRISMLRFDPCEFADARICIEHIVFEK